MEKICLPSHPHDMNVLMCNAGIQVHMADKCLVCEGHKSVECAMSLHAV